MDALDNEWDTAPWAKKQCRWDAAPSSIDLYGDGIQYRVMSGELSASPKGISQESIFEPQPVASYTNLAEMLSRTDLGFPGSVDGGGTFAGHRDTFDLMGLRSPQYHAAELPIFFFQRLVRFLDFETYLSVRLVCRCWSAAISFVRPPRLPSAFFLPAEIILQIYALLSPADYNAARHTCRFWMLVSLDNRLLETMLKRGGWSSAARTDAVVQDRCGYRGAASEEWLLSKRMSTECSLRQGWTGTDVSKRPPGSSTSHLYLNDLNIRCSPSGQEIIVLGPGARVFDQGYRDANYTQRSLHGLLFVISICSRYLLVADDCRISIYTLGSDWASFTGGRYEHVEAAATIICPHRVLAISMDTSLSSFAVAALLEDRVGLVCELQEGPSIMEHHSLEAYPLEGTSSIIGGNSASMYNSHSWDEGNDSSEAAICNLRSNRSSWIRSDHSNSSHIFPSSHKTDAKLKVGPCTVYRNLCSEHDPPLSVAICPQRRCIAFGCSSGVELHWVEAITGQSLNRWFPLADSSDYLYFLPGMQDLDGKRRLRLISSKAHPSTDVSVNRRCYSIVNRHWYGDHWWRDPAGWDELRIEKQCHHRYQTVPVSDGRHVLFTDSLTGLVSLGSDAPEEEDGIEGNRLRRRFVLAGPSEVDQDGNSVTVPPRVYKAAVELRWGVRIAVGYTNGEVWCFGVPGDWFFDALVAEKSVDDEENGIDDDAEIEVVTVLPGVRLGVVAGLTDIGVWAGGGGIMAWGCGDGKINAWTVGQGDNGTWRYLDGELVRVDQDGDVVMCGGEEGVGIEEGEEEEEENWGEVGFWVDEEDQGYGSGLSE